MIESIIRKVLKKKKYKAEIYIENEDFTATFYSDTYKKAVDWIFSGIHESNTIENKTDMENNILKIKGFISKFKLLHKTNKNTLIVFDYAKGSDDEAVVLSSSKLFIPNSILNNITNLK